MGQGENREGEVFEFFNEMEGYCRSDVDILRQACLKFLDILMYIIGKKDLLFDEESECLYTRLRNGIDPFANITIASVCMKVFKSKYLRDV